MTGEELPPARPPADTLPKEPQGLLARGCKRLTFIFLGAALTTVFGVYYYFQMTDPQSAWWQKLLTDLIVVPLGLFSFAAFLLGLFGKRAEAYAQRRAKHASCIASIFMILLSLACLGIIAVAGILKLYHAIHDR